MTHKGTTLDRRASRPTLQGRPRTGPPCTARQFPRFMRPDQHHAGPERGDSASSSALNRMLPSP